LDLIREFLFPGKSYQQSVSAYQSALKYDPENAKAQNNLGSAYMEMGELEKAASHFSTATKFDGGYALAYRNAGDVNIRLGNFSEAIEWLGKATEADPENLFGWYWLGRAYVGAGQPKTAIPHFLRVLTRRPELPQVHHDLGEAYFLIEIMRKAWNMCKQACASILPVLNHTSR
jgi:tetratricopeptide (TPR) repeat protein